MSSEIEKTPTEAAKKAAQSSEQPNPETSEEVGGINFGPLSFGGRYSKPKSIPLLEVRQPVKGLKIHTGAFFTDITPPTDDSLSATTEAFQYIQKLSGGSGMQVKATVLPEKSVITKDFEQESVKAVTALVRSLNEDLKSYLKS